MPRISTLAALLAAIMLMIGGGAARAASCDACPPKCPMMAQVQTAKAAAHQHAPISGKGGKADDPCKESLLCQGSAGRRDRAGAGRRCRRPGEYGIGPEAARPASRGLASA
jgi:hypothetical protein